LNPDVLVSVRNLTISFGAVEAVRGLSFDVRGGEVLAVVGESGAGKSLTARALLGMPPRQATVSGSIRMGTHELVGAPRSVRTALWGHRLTLVPQDALSALSPVHRVADQLAAAVRSVDRVSRKAARARAMTALEEVGIAADQARSYPHEFSGGMRQRAVIAMALLHSPALVVADEPTTAQDPETRRQVLDLLTHRSQAAGATLVLVTHDLPTVHDHADRVLVMHKGQLAEEGPVAEVIGPRQAPLKGREAVPCAAPPPLSAPLDRGDPHHGRDQPQRTRGHQLAATPRTPHPLLHVRDLVVRHGSRTTVDHVSFDIAPGETLGLIGPSGCGKSSTALAVLQLRRPDDGEVWFDGQELTSLDERRLRPLRPAMQPVFQDPYGSLSPRHRIRDAIAEPLRAQGGWDRESGPARVAELLDQVGLDPSHGDRRPHELSGGQCQRAGIARALASEPKLLVLDEPVSALDPPLRAGILNLLTELQERLGLGYLFICHDMELVRHFCDRVAQMRDGRIVRTTPPPPSPPLSSPPPSPRTPSRSRPQPR